MTCTHRAATMWIFTTSFTYRLLVWKEQSMKKKTKNKKTQTFSYIPKHCSFLLSSASFNIGINPTSWWINMLLSQESCCYHHFVNMETETKRGKAHCSGSGRQGPEPKSPSTQPSSPEKSSLSIHPSCLPAFTDRYTQAWFSLQFVFWIVRIFIKIWISKDSQNISLAALKI